MLAHHAHVARHTAGRRRAAQQRTCKRRSCLVYARRRDCHVYDLHNQLIPYQQAWDWQKLLLARTLEATPTGGDHDSVLLLQHPPVYTLGAGSTEEHLLFDPATSDIPLYRTERGGEVTYHGPGQLVMYPILNLQHHTQDLHWYMRSLEEVVIRALDNVSGIEAGRIPGLTGVWVDGAKVAAIGVRAKKWVTYHGLALNVTTDLTPFRSIVPCGIAGKPVGSVRTLLDDQCMTLDPFLGDGQVKRVESESELLLEYRYALLDAFSEVFDVSVQPGDLEVLRTQQQSTTVV